MINAICKAIEKYFLDHKWNVGEINGQGVFYKARSPNSLSDNCFLSYSKRRVSSTYQELSNSFRRRFSPEFKDATSSQIILPNSTSFFLTSGIQIFERDLVTNVPSEGRLLFLQPVIRTNYRDSVREGSVSSFVNLSTLRFGGQISEYLRDIDSWICYLSESGLFANDLNLKLKIKTSEKDSPNPWRKKEGISLSFSYGGLSLGEANYCWMPDQTESPFIDIGFGLERILWASNKGSFFDEIGPMPFCFKESKKKLDSIRTVTLMSLAGLERDTKDPFRQFQIYLDEISGNAKSELFEASRYYYSFWANFIQGARDFNETYAFLKSETNRRANLKVMNLLGIKRSKTIEEDIYLDEGEFIQRLCKRNLTTLDKVKSVYKTQS